MDDIAAIVANIPDFHGWNHVKKIKLFAWFLHSQGKEQFSSTDIRLAYEKLYIDKPANITSLLDQLSEKNPRELLKGSRGYSMVGRLRDEMSRKYSARHTAVYISTLLRELPVRLPNLAERTYLDEALACFNAGAFRASIVMCWNLAYDHLCEFVLSMHLTDFNTQLPKSFPKAEISVVGKKDDFQELKESQVLQVCKSANIISGSLHKILKEKLDRRNIAAHPSGVVVSQPTAEEFIKDLIENVVLKFV
jgi:hypothetical protein